MMTIEEAFEIIMKDTDYTDLRKWEDRHWEAQDTYWKHMGFSKEVRQRMRDDLMVIRDNLLKKRGKVV